MCIINQLYKADANDRQCHMKVLLLHQQGTNQTKRQSSLEFQDAQAHLSNNKKMQATLELYTWRSPKET